MLSKPPPTLFSPRALTPNEAGVLSALLGQDFPGATALRLQAASARAVGGCSCGCASIDLAVDPDSPAANETRSPIPSRAFFDRPEHGGGIIVFLSTGRLSLLEIYTYGSPAAAWPPLADLRLEVT